MKVISPILFPRRSNAARAPELPWFAQLETPGTFRKLGGATTAGAFHALATPVRVYDSRPGTKPTVGSKTPLGPNSPRTVDPP